MYQQLSFLLIILPLVAITSNGHSVEVRPHVFLDVKDEGVAETPAKDVLSFSDDPKKHDGREEPETYWLEAQEMRGTEELLWHYIDARPGRTLRVSFDSVQKKWRFIPLPSSVPWWNPTLVLRPDTSLMRGDREDVRTDLLESRLSLDDTKNIVNAMTSKIEFDKTVVVEEERNVVTVRPINKEDRQNHSLLFQLGGHRGVETCKPAGFIVDLSILLSSGKSARTEQKAILPLPIPRQHSFFTPIVYEMSLQKNSDGRIVWSANRLLCHQFTRFDGGHISSLWQRGVAIFLTETSNDFVITLSELQSSRRMEDDKVGFVFSENLVAIILPGDFTDLTSSKVVKGIREKIAVTFASDADQMNFRCETEQRDGIFEMRLESGTLTLPKSSTKHIQDLATLEPQKTTRDLPQLRKALGKGEVALVYPVVPTKVVK